MHFVGSIFFSSHFFLGNSFNGINPVVPAIDGAGTTGLISLKLFPTKEWEDKKKIDTLQVNWQMHFVRLKEIQSFFLFPFFCRKQL